MNKMLIFAITFLFGCATIVRGPKQEVLIKTNYVSKNEVKCNLTNTQGTWATKLNTLTTIHRDYYPLYVFCFDGNFESQNEIFAKSTTGFIVADFFIDFNTISGLIDGLTYSIYSYPKEIDIIMKDKYLTGN